jgi:hypothetical protein
MVQTLYRRPIRDLLQEAWRLYDYLFTNKRAYLHALCCIDTSGGCCLVMDVHEAQSAGSLASFISATTPVWPEYDLQIEKGVQAIEERPTNTQE